MPVHVSETPQVLTLDRLIAGKLSTCLGLGIARSHDYADVVKLVEANQLPRDYAVDHDVREEYQKIWDALHAR